MKQLYIILLLIFLIILIVSSHFINKNIQLKLQELSPVDCQLSNWTEWECDRTTGQKTRTRAIIQPELNGGATCGPTKDTQSCERDCTMNNWTEWSCDRTIGEKTRTRTTIQPELNGGICGPTKDTQSCERDCELNPFPTEWSLCDKQTGKKQMSTTIKYSDRNGGLTCSPTTKVTDCPVDCELNPFPIEWSDCDKQTGKKQMSTTIKYSDRNGGLTCSPTTKVTDCPVECELSWNDWETCNQQTGKQKRIADTIITPNLSNTCSPTLEYKDCSCEVINNDNNWTDCDKNTGIRRNIGQKIYTEMINENLDTCPSTIIPIEEPCPVNCELENEWTYKECIKNTGKRTKSKRVLVEAKNGGLTCSDIIYRDGYYVHEIEENCPVDCEVGMPSLWSVCDKRLGIQTSTKEVIYQKRDGLDINGNNVSGNTCPPTTLTKNCSVNCETRSPSPTFSNCDKSNGTMKKRILVEFPPRNNGTSCGPTMMSHGYHYIEELKNCKVDCDVETSNPPCNLLTGEIKPTLKVNFFPKSGYDNNIGTGQIKDGMPCPTVVAIPCRVDCDYITEKVNPEHNCGVNNIDKIEYNVRINRLPQNGGNTCPPSRLIVPCSNIASQIIGYSKWSECDKTTGRMSRDKITSPPLNGGLPVSENLIEYQNCKVDCELRPWPAWSPCNLSTGKRTAKRDFLYNPRDGIDEYGNSVIGMTCPPQGVMGVTLTEMPCLVDCKSTSGDWGICTDLNTELVQGSGVMGKQRRTNNVDILPHNGGITCPPYFEYKTCDHQSICVNGKVKGYNTTGANPIPICECDTKYTTNSTDGKCTLCRTPYFNDASAGCIECNRNGTFNGTNCVCNTGLDPASHCSICKPGFAGVRPYQGCIYSVNTTCNGNAHSVSTEGICTCKDNWSGSPTCDRCDNLRGYYGENANCSYTSQSRCNGRGKPDRPNGLCTCDDPQKYTGDFCNVCKTNYTMKNGSCIACNGEGNIVGGTCVCNGVGFDGNTACTSCKPGYGPPGSCSIMCNNRGNVVNGVCVCNPPWVGSMCEIIPDDAFTIENNVHYYPSNIVTERILTGHTSSSTNIMNEMKKKCVLNNYVGFKTNTKPWNTYFIGYDVTYFIDIPIEIIRYEGEITHKTYKLKSRWS